MLNTYRFPKLRETALAASLACLPEAAVLAQTTVGIPEPKSTAVARDISMPAGKIFVDTNTFLQPRAGFTTNRVRLGCVGNRPSPCNSSLAGNHNGAGAGGGFRVTCTASHMSFDDPIVWPGQAGRTHLHLFFGATQTNALSDIDNMHLLNSSTCSGGPLNNSGYWVPPPVYHRPGHPRDGEVFTPYANVAYYKTEGYDPLGSGAVVVWPPPGHRMIAGDPNNTNPALLGNQRFDCLDSSAVSHSFNHIPTTAEVTALGAGGCQTLIQLIFFPSCWDGVSKGVLGKGHMAEADFFLGCTDPAYPVSFPHVSFNIFYTAPPAADFDYLYLSCDSPSLPANAHGACTHGDWLNGWKQNITTGWGIPGITKSVTTTIIDFCTKGGRDPVNGGNDCKVNILGDPVNINEWWLLY